MRDGWERALALAEKHAQAGGIFVRLANDGDKVVGAFCGEPHAREVVWNGTHFEAFDPDKHKNTRPALRVMINIYVPAEGRTKIIEVSSSVYRDICQLRRKYTTDKWLFEIERHGAAGSPRTKFSVLPDSQIDPELAARVAAAERHDLANIGVGDEEEDDGQMEPVPRPAPKLGAPSAAAPAQGNGAPAVVHPDVALDLVARLKVLPRAEADAFLKRFAIGRVRDLKASDEAAARRFVEEAERRHAPAAADEERDPFAM